VARRCDPCPRIQPQPGQQSGLFPLSREMLSWITAALISESERDTRSLTLCRRTVGYCVLRTTDAIRTERYTMRIGPNRDSKSGTHERSKLRPYCLHKSYTSSSLVSDERSNNTATCSNKRSKPAGEMISRMRAG
jgi:hypothetical protein